MNDAVLTETRDSTLVITLNRPQVRNAVDRALAMGVASALDRLDADSNLRVGVITGAGRGFCAGMDLKAFVAGESPVVARRGFAGITERAPRKPLIAAIEGFAVAGGLEIALACDLIVAARDAKLGLPEVRRGLVAVAGGLVRLARRVPYHVAMELALLGQVVDAEALAPHGLVNRLVEPGDALATALDLANAITENAPLSLEASKRIVIEQADWSAVEMWKAQERIATPIRESADAREGAIAFAEKRAPRWTGA